MNIPTSRKLIYLGILLFLTFAVTEGIWQIYSAHQLSWLTERLDERNDFLEEDPDLKHVLRPGNWSRPAPPELGGVFHFRVNEERLRGPEIVAGKEPGTFRILCLGGSTTFGTGFLADHETYPAQLESALAKRLPERRIQVLNAGVPGYQTVDSYANLQRLRHLDPDLILVYHAINDIAWAADLGEFYFQPETTTRPLTRLERRRIDADSFFPQAVYNRLFRWHHKPSRETPRQSIPQRYEDGFAANLGRIVELARSIGSDVAFITFEIGIDPTWPPEKSAEKAAHYTLGAVHLRYAEIAPTVRRYNARTRRVAADLGVPLLDIEGRISKDDEFWADPVHLSTRGTTRMVALVLKRLLEILKDA